MPVVELSYSRLKSLIGNVSKKQIEKSLPFLGLDIEAEHGDLVKVEYSPNRPDYSTCYGIALGLQGLLGIKTGIINLDISRGDSAIDVTSKVTKIRPYITGIIARGKVDNTLIKQLVAMQEDLHIGMGRRRKKSSIGIHDLDKISFPLTYTTTNRNHKFRPLNLSTEMTVQQILKNTDVGKDYGKILGNFAQVPILLDAKNKTVSLPPIINAADTALTNKTRNIFVEVTGINKTVEDVLAVLALTLQTAGFTLETVKISGAENATPKLETTQMKLESNLVNDTLGVNLSGSEIASCLQKSRLGASVKDNFISCIIPPYRFDILGTMDLVEEAALGYGIENLKPVLLPPQTLGETNNTNTQIKKLGELMVGLGYTEALNSCLTSKRILCDMTDRSNKTISVLDSKSKEHTRLRDLILPELVENLSRNVHAPYPQRLFEIGTVFGIGDFINETINLACVSAHKDASYTEIKSILQSILGDFGIEIQTKASSVAMFENGRTATVMSGKKVIGVIGEIDAKVTSAYKIRVPVVGFEIYISGLIFDLTNN